MLYTISLIIPLAWGMLSSVKDSWEFDDSSIAFPKIILFENYKVAIQAFSTKVDSLTGPKTISFFQMITNTLLYAFGSAFMVTLIPCLTSYIVAKFKFRVLRIYYIIVVVTMALPIVGNLPSSLQIAKLLGLYDNIWGLWLMKGYFIGMYFLVFYASFKTIPDSFSEAAQIDGASNFAILTRIILPLIKTTFSTIMLIQFIGFWNDYLTPRVFMPSVPTLAVGLFKFSFSSSDSYSSPPIQLAGCMLLLLPILLIYIVLQEKLIGNITMGGIKE